jgi:LacI family transcriptional regulator
MAVTAKDIARKLNISTAAVSMALNNRPGIGEDTRYRILGLAKELGYKVQRRSLHSQSKSLNLVVYKKHGDVVSDTPFFAELTQGIESQTKKSGYNLLVTYFYESQNQAEQLSRIIASPCRGIILLATEMISRDLRIFSSLSVPMVILDNTFYDVDIDSITINNIQGSMEAVKYLKRLGHRKIGHLRSKVGIHNFYERRDGYLKTIDEESNLKYTVSVPSTSDGAYKEMKEYLSANPEIPTAYFADNDIIAISCIRAMREAGCRIPLDVSVVGFDDIPASEIMDPPLSTMRVPKKTMGILAVEQLMKRIHNDNSESIRVAVNTRLVVRASVKTVDLQ